MVAMLSNVYHNKKVIITGDTGFKGTWLSIWLKELGADVYGYSFPTKSKMDNYNLCNLGGIISHKDGDVRDKKEILQYFKDIQPDFAFHLAAQPLVLDSIENPHKTYSTNVMGTVNFLEAVRLTPSVKVALNITSDKCYKNKNWSWGYREIDELGGSDPYSSSKSISELITDSYIKTYFNTKSSTSIATVRAGNVLGAGDWAKFRIIPDIFRSFLNKKTLIIRNPSFTRPWQHVLEPLSGYLMVAQKLYENGKEYQGAWNFGPANDKKYTVLDVVNKLNEFGAGINYKVKSEKNIHKEHVLLSLDTSKSNTLLNWYPRFTFSESIKYILEGYLSDINGKSAIDNRTQMIKTFCEKNN
jgi:CDP-glucose 4,6-dehydratase